MIQILDRDYGYLKPTPPSKKAIACFDMEAARICFRECGDIIDFVIALDESTKQFEYCFSLMECERFWDKSKK